MNPVSLDQIFVNARAALLQAIGRLLPQALMPYVDSLMGIGVIAAVAPLIMMYLTLYERKVIARMQNRFGPTRVGVYGLLQPLSDGLKMLMKEDIVPRGADGLIHIIGPILAVAPAILAFAVLPFGRNMTAVDLNIGVLYLFAVSSVGSYAIFMGGWASRSKFSVIGAMRAVAQLVSYEAPGVLSMVAVIMIAGTLSTVGIVEAQARGGWYVFTPWGFVGAIIFFLVGTAETNRTPFDMPEAESELVGGFHTEYSGMKFALWYMAEFLEAFLISAFTVTFFLGGWDGPSWIPFWVLGFLLAVISGMAKLLALPFRVFATVMLLAASWYWRFQPIPSWVWFFAKTYALIFVLVWFRGTFPRLRADQLMGLAWKFLLPMTLINVVAAGIWWIYRASFIGTIASAVILIVSYWALVRLNHPAPLTKRTYVFAD